MGKPYRILQVWLMDPRSGEWMYLCLQRTYLKLHDTQVFDGEALKEGVEKGITHYSGCTESIDESVFQLPAMCFH